MKFKKICISFIFVLVLTCFALPVLATKTTGLGQAEYFLNNAAKSAGVDTNPKGNDNSVIAVMGDYAQVFLGLVGAIATMFIIYGSFIWITAGGSEEKVTTAKKYIINAAIGLVIGSLAYMIVSLVINLATPNAEKTRQVEESVEV